MVENVFAGLYFILSGCYCTTSSKENASPAAEISFKNKAKMRQKGWRQLAFSGDVVLSGQKF